MPPKSSGRGKGNDHDASPAKQETHSQFDDGRIETLEVGFTAIEATLSDIAARQSNTDVQFGKTTEALNRILLRLDSELPLSGRQQTAAAPSGGLGSEVRPEVISNLRHQFETPRPSGTPPLDPMTSMSAVRVNTSGMDGKRRGTTRRY